MNTSTWEDKIIAYLEGDLPARDKDLLFNEVDQNEDVKEIWNQYNSMYSDISGMPVDQPSPAMKTKYDNWLTTEVDSYKEETKVIPFLNWQKAAGIAAIFICIAGFWKMYDQNRQMSNSLASLEKMMDVQSPTERIKAIRVNYQDQTTTVDNQMITVLIDVLHHDVSSNVRLACVETLSSYMQEESVRTTMIKALNTEKDGAVKLAIIEVLGQQENEESIKTLQNIVNDDSHEQFVIDGAHMELIRLDKVKI